MENAPMICDFESLKENFKMAKMNVFHNKDWYTIKVMDISKDNFLFRGVVNRRAKLEFELIKPNKDFIKIYFTKKEEDVDVHFKYYRRCIENSNYSYCDCGSIKSFENFCDTLGWTHDDVQEFEKYLNLYM